MTWPDKPSSLFAYGYFSLFDGNLNNRVHPVTFISTSPKILRNFNNVITMYDGDDARDFFYFHKKFGGRCTSIKGDPRYAQASLGYGSVLHVFTKWEVPPWEGHPMAELLKSVTHDCSMEKCSVSKDSWIPLMEMVEFPYYYETGDHVPEDAGCFVFNHRDEDRGFWEGKPLVMETTAACISMNVTPS
jgi:hypothetical protein